MTSRAQAWALVARVRAADAAAAKPAAADETPYDRLMRAAENGQYEALVAKARPAQPPAMVTPEEREAELRAAGRWPADRPAPPPPPEAGPPREPDAPPVELTPNELYIAETCQWRERGPADYAPRHKPGKCLTEYDVLAEVSYAHDRNNDGR